MVPLAVTRASRSRFTIFSVVTSSPVARAYRKLANRMPPRTTTMPPPTSALREPVIRLPAVEDEGDAERDDQVQAKERQRNPSGGPSVQDAEADRDDDDPPAPEEVDESQHAGEQAVFGQHREEHPEVRRPGQADRPACELHGHRDERTQD